MSILSRFLKPVTQNNAGLVIETMHRRHIRAILDIEENIYPKPWTADVFGSEIDLARHGQRYYVIAKIDGILVGYAGLLFALDEAHVTNIAVNPLNRRQGISRQLMSHLAHEAITRGSQALTLEVRVSNSAAQGLYREFGFAPAGVRQKYYENTEDAIVMWAHDIQGIEYRQRLNQIGAK